MILKNSLNLWALTLISLLVLLHQEQTDGKVKFYGVSTSSSTILNAVTGTILSVDNWYHVLFSFDMANSSNRYVYINDSADTTTWNTYTNATIDLTRTNHRIGWGVAGPANQEFNGDMAEMWLDLGNYLDISSLSNREKFIDASGKPVDLGSDGSNPTSTSPINISKWSYGRLAY